jgi:hypothetical protein
MGAPDHAAGGKNGYPHLESAVPRAALPGGEIRIQGRGLRPAELRQPRVQFGDLEAAVVISADDFVVARVPEGAASGGVVVATNGQPSNPVDVRVAVQLADELHPVANPALDAEGNVFATFSGTRGEKVPVAIFKIDTNYQMKPFVVELMNPTGMAFDRAGQLYASSRHDGSVYRVTPAGSISTYAEGMGIATGIAFDRVGNLYVGDRGNVGDRSGTIFKIAPDRQVFVFATLEPSVAAYHLAFSPSGDLYVSGPTTSSFDCIYKITPRGEVSVFYRGLGRPQGIAFDIDGNLYVAASLRGKRGIVKITPQQKAALEVSGHNLVGLAFAPGRAAILATTSAVYRLAWDIQGAPLLSE